MTDKEQCMKLAHLMREGCKLTKPVRGMMYARSTGGGHFACAIGAVLYAGAIGAVLYADGREPNGKYAIESLVETYPVLNKKTGPIYNLLDDIMTKNDLNDYSREAIADWLETLEWPDE